MFCFVSYSTNTQVCSSGGEPLRDSVFEELHKEQHQKALQHFTLAIAKVQNEQTLMVHQDELEHMIQQEYDEKKRINKANQEVSITWVIEINVKC